MIYEYFKNTLSELEENNGLRKLNSIKSTGKYIEFKGSKLLNLSTNDYLGISNTSELNEKFTDFLKQNNYDISYGACSSRLLTGNHYAYQILETYLTKLYKKEAALVFNSGYHANIGILPAICKKKDLIISDKLVHASLIDGIRLSNATHLRFKHNDYEHLEKILSENSDKYEHIFVVTESIFSMDGDLADLQKLVNLKSKYGFYIYLDEAHAIGVRAENGTGLAEEQNLTEHIDILVGTFGKAVSSQGAYVVGERSLIDFLINKSRSLIFTTALPSINILYIYFIMKEIETMKEQRKHLFEISDKLRNSIKNAGFETAGNSHIVPMIIGNNAKSIKMSELLANTGFLALPIRYPTVPKGTERIRFSLTAAILEKDIEELSKNTVNIKYNFFD